MFHGSCADMKMIHWSVLRILSTNVLWMCDDCMHRFQQSSFCVMPGVSSDPTNDDVITPKPKAKPIEAEIEELKSNVANIMSTIATIIKKPAIVPTSTAVDIAKLHPTPVSTFNRIDVCESLNDDDSQPRHQRTMESDKFSLLLSNIDESVSERDIQLMVSKAIGLQHPECIDVTKLVSKWNRRKMDYVSFKVVLDKQFKYRAIDPQTWPNKVKFRVFVDRQNDTWVPNR